MAYKRSFSNKTNPSTSSSNDTVIELDKKKQITVRKFNNVNLVDIREFYIDKDTNEKKPGKKGISLTEDTWLKLVQSSGEVQDALDVLNGVEPNRKRTKQSENNENDADKKEAAVGDNKPEAKKEEEESDEDAD
ncbi:uncharacterized protein AC631_03987 [Debaryomyces fabryi]|uniref:Transcriptional coactivator p15 (PC4) C-terminal domain-containing protein n=1 Tax=Debaryomyces fabryi TaxID=58627 RepID=A0A0V1PVN0_9ASCO|nr:uncharacterized protein AC631_03987 [Debaryomyces fabryi]KSA00240.1 hypothetical protein AC631_03987 [Debaryomyces fabryi]CUM46360.1 unnamed protein product [Debaryomyces fabryi]